MTADHEGRASIIDTIIDGRNEKVVHEAELQRRLEEAKLPAQELSASLRQLFEEHFPPFSDDISQVELAAMSQDDRFKVLFPSGWMRDANSNYIAILKGEIARAGEEPISFKFESGYPRRHRNPNNSLVTIDVDGLDDLFTVWSTGGKLVSKLKHGHVPDNPIVGGRGYPTYPDREGQAFAEDFAWYQEFLNDISKAEIKLTPSYYREERHR